MKPFFDLIKRVMWMVLLTLVIIVVALIALLFYWSWPGEPRPFVDDHGVRLPRSLAIKHFARINGVQQGMFIVSKDTTRQVLLHLHGGLPEYFLNSNHSAGLVDHFTVVWWEQRGSGLSYDASVDPETITADQLVDDAIELTNVLRKRFAQEKIYLMGHSGGTFIGLRIIKQAPELFHAYIGVAQMADQATSEVLAYDHMLQEYRKRGDRAMIRRLEDAPVTVAGGIPRSYLKIRDKAMHELGIGTTRQMRSVLKGIMLPSLQCRDLTFAEKINLWKGKIKSGVSPMWSEMIGTDLREEINGVDIPVYFLHGIHDHTCSYALAKDLFERIQAPVKGFYSFQHSAHSPSFEEPARTLEIMAKDVLQGTNTLADPIEAP